VKAGCHFQRKGANEQAPSRACFWLFVSVVSTAQADNPEDDGEIRQLRLQIEAMQPESDNRVRD